MPYVRPETLAFYEEQGYEMRECILCSTPYFAETNYEKRGVCVDCTKALVNDFAMQHSGAPDPRVDPEGYRAANSRLIDKWKPVSEEVRWQVFNRDGYKCQICGSLCALTVDHINPRSRGGTDEITNLQTLCRSCNCKKGAKP